MLYRAIYVSRYAPSFENGGRVEDFIGSARAFNQSRAVTGLLLVAAPHFVQVLEGTRRAVTEVLERVMRDTRHKDIEIVEMLPVVKRHFFAWDMVHATLQADDALLKPYAHGPEFDPAELDPASLTELLIEAARRES